MESSKRIHPLVATAAASVVLVSVVGIAAMTGLLPNFNSSANKPELASATSATTSASAPVSTTALAAAEEKYPASQTEAPPAKSNPPKAAVKPRPVTSESPAPAPAPRPAPVRVAEATQATSPGPVYAAPPVAQARICADCGRVQSVQAVASQPAPSGLGVLGGAVVGGLLGNQVGNGNGRTLATVAGAVGGGYAGNEVEKRTRSATTYQVQVRMEDGQIRTFPYNEAPRWNVGDRVRVVDGYLTSNS